MKIRTATSRRQFLSHLAGGMALTTLGLEASTGLGFALPHLDEDTDLDFGHLADLVDLLTESDLSELQVALVNELRNGRSLEDLAAAGALANARAFGGEDYIGYHAFMALMPAYQMSSEMPRGQEALPVLKVLYRGTERMQRFLDGRRPVIGEHPRPIDLPEEVEQQLVEEVRQQNLSSAESSFDAVLRERRSTALEALIPVVCQEKDVHRVVLAWRGHDLLRLTGEEHARILMRQSIRQCVAREASKSGDPIRRDLFAVLEESGVFEAPLGERVMDDAWVASRGREIVNGSMKHGAELVAQDLVDGVSPDSIGEALSYGCTDLMLRQLPRTKAGGYGLAPGDVHGAGTGIHSADTTAAWRAMAGFGSDHQRKLALVAGGYHAAGRGGVGKQRFGYKEIELPSREAGDLLGVLGESLRGQDQLHAAAAADRYVRLGHGLRPMFDLLLATSVSADGALHAEKYYRTQVEVMGSDRASQRPDHAAALARVCASQHGYQAPGHEQALELLG